MIMIPVLIVALGKVDASMMVMKNIFAGCKENPANFQQLTHQPYHVTISSLMMPSCHQLQNAQTKNLI